MGIQKKSIANQKSIYNWLNTPIKKIFAITTGFLTIAGIGYSVAVIQKNLEFKLEKIEMNQECNERVEAKAEQCKQIQQELIDKKVDNIELVIKEIKRSLIEK